MPLPVTRALRSLWDSGDLGPPQVSRGAASVVIVATVVIVGGVMLARVPVGPVVMLALVALGLVWTVRRLFPPGRRRAIGRLAAIAFITHVAAAAVLFAVSYVTGHGGFYFGDDVAYDAIGRIVSEYLRGTGDPRMGPPTWGGYAYLLSTYGALVSAVYTVLGPETLSMEVLNAGLMTAAVVLLYDVAERIFDREKAMIAAVAAAFFPSVQLWSVLNLKDALSLFFVFGALSAVARFQSRPRPTTFLVALLFLAPMVDLRLWLYYLLAVAVVVAVALTLRLPFAARVAWIFVAVIAVVSVLQVQASNAISKTFGPGALVSLAVIRQAMAGQAHSGFGGATPLPLQVPEGAMLIVVTPIPAALVPTPSATIPPPNVTPPSTPAPAASTATTAASPTPTHSVGPPTQSPPPTQAVAAVSPTPIIVAPGTKLVLAPTPPADASQPSPPPGAVFVKPGDRVIVLAEGNTPSPGEAARPVLVPADQDAITVSTNELVSVAQLAHVPEGLMYALFAPFPWVIPSLPYLGVSFDMLLWYVVLVGAVWSVWLHRERWQLYAPPVLLVLGIVGVFALVEGNLGTLFRHRGMVIPATIVLASPALKTWLVWIHHRLPARFRGIADRAVTQLS